MQRKETLGNTLVQSIAVVGLLVGVGALLVVLSLLIGQTNGIGIPYFPLYFHSFFGWIWIPF